MATATPVYYFAKDTQRLSFVIDLCLEPGYDGLRMHDDDPRYTVQEVAEQVRQILTKQPKRSEPGYRGIAGATVHPTRTVYSGCPVGGELSMQICGGQTRLDELSGDQVAFWRSNVIWLGIELAKHYGQATLHVCFSDGIAYPIVRA